MDEQRLSFGKPCTKCGEWQLYEDFSLAKHAKDGRHSWCKSCVREYQIAHRYGSRREEILEQNRKTAKARREADIELYRKRGREAAQRPGNRAKRLAYNKKRYEENREELNEQTRLYRRANPEKVRAKNDRYRRLNLERCSFWASQYYFRRQANGGGGCNYEQWLDLCEQHGNVCLCCGADDPLTMDHIVPISLGGQHDLSNIQPLCKPCNSRKSAKTIDYRPQTIERQQM